MSVKERRGCGKGGGQIRRLWLSQLDYPRLPLAHCPIETPTQFTITLQAIVGAATAFMRIRYLAKVPKLDQQAVFFSRLSIISRKYFFGYLILDFWGFLDIL